MLCVDTSFLFSLYRQDVHSAAAVSFLTKAARPLLLSVLNDYELGNALRLAEHRGLLPTGESSRRLDAFAEDRAAGLWRRSEVALEDVVAEAGRLSRDYTAAAGHRAFGILHVAHARLVRPKAFLTFDAHQVRLAKAVGLTVGP